ncbi:hypothetical protein C0J52_20216, partial [Blattella germanica]
YLIRNICQHNCFICCFDKIFHIPFWRKSIFGESITIPKLLLDQKYIAECYPQSLSNSSLQNVQTNERFLANDEKLKSQTGTSQHIPPSWE